jgi:exodeoxyribonuclease VII large subunit
VMVRARTRAQLSRAPAQHVARHRQRLHQLLRELRAGTRRTGERGLTRAGVHAVVLQRSATRAQSADRVKRDRDLERLSLALGAHDPQRTMARGYALVQDRSGSPLGSAASARQARELRLRFHDGAVAAQVTEEPDR